MSRGAASTAFCATGYSGGAAQVAYMLSHYGLGDILASVVPTGGPPMARMDRSCARDEPAFREKLRQASVASGDGDYQYPRTMVWFVFEGIDDTHAVAMGTTYHDLLLERKSPLVKKTTIPDVSHSGPKGLYNSRSGTDKMRDILLEACRPRTP